MMSFKFLHIADVHLDTPFENKDADIRVMLREKLRGALKASVDAAIINNVDALLIAGDLFDNDTLSFATEKFIIEQMIRLKGNGIRVFYCTGNHDPSGANYKTLKIKWPDNVYIFKNSKVETVKVLGSDGIVKAVIAGAGHEGNLEGRNLAENFPIGDKNYPYIGLLHTCIKGRYGDKSLEKYAPCSLSDLVDKNYSYWALGHIHIKDIISEFPHIIYPGCICGRNPKETGMKGAVLVEIDRGVKYSFIPLSSVIWETILIDDISKAKDFSDLTGHIREKIYQRKTENGGSDSYMIRVILSGPTVLFRELQKNENISLLEDELKYSLNTDFIEIKTEGIVKPVDPEKYRGEVHILGTALDFLEEVKSSRELLNKIMPSKFAGIPLNASNEEKVQYMIKLLDGLDYELCERLLGGEEK
jgi:DNA repair exonuclease SbcCD nuclease subunit